MSDTDNSQSESSVEEATKKRKRGVRNDENYQRNVIKKSRVQGKAYVNYKGNAVAARQLGDGCRCPMKYFEKLNDDKKIELLNRFHSLNSKDDQDIYLQGLLEVVDVKRRSKLQNPENANEKTCSFHHYVPIDGKRRKVCQKAFLSLFSVEENNMLIRQHIESFPVKETHYSNKTYLYLDAKLNMKIMFDMFKVKYPTTKIRYSYFVKYFHEHFDLHFGRPQVDTCCKCEELDLKIKSPSLGDASKRAAAAELAVHKRRAKKFYWSLKQSTDECKIRDDLAVITFDYMQNLHLPEVPVQDLFYLTQLTVNIFGIHNCKTDKAFFYVYHEGITSKGPNDVCSFLWDYIQREIPENVQELRLYSDNCPGQNKNHTMVRMCAALDSKKLNNFFLSEGIPSCLMTEILVSSNGV
ncbi:unnamed protein product [Brassicogethes aeneus]|uniref:Uncharacterized protein n=1 Tax=Brassicogethes aeneus TaxID=1431903 RepID=A0A9P0BH41_BRAAE|nr:unnamed protein product [Brassicogethes aeneus]